MLRVELRALEVEDLVLEETGSANQLGIELTPGLCSAPLEIQCAISKSGDYILAKGWVQGLMRLSCDRCLAEFESPYKSFFEFQYRRSEDREPDEVETEISLSQVEILYFDGEILDIADAVRQTVLLSEPMRALCREACRGLCGGCGGNLNLEACHCEEPPTDFRWEALKRLKL
ncbi:MAG: YceD family protein [bacterium]